MAGKATSPLRRRMIEDISIRTFSGKTQHDYIRITIELAEPTHIPARDFLPCRLSGAGPPARVANCIGPASETLHKSGYDLPTPCPSSNVLRQFTA